MWLRRVLVAAVAAAALSAAVMASTASAYGPSYCNRSTCSLASGPYTGSIYFEMPRGTAESMVCWTDTQWFAGTNRWFKVRTIYGTGFTSANMVSNQTPRTPHC